MSVSWIRTIPALVVLSLVVAIAMFASPAKPAGAAANDVLYGLAGSGELVSFNASAPGTITARVSVKGLQPGEKLVGIDFRPANGQLYGVGSSSRIYIIDRNSGVASAVGGRFNPSLDGSVFGFNFNPAVDLIRLTSDTGLDLRLSPNTGQVVGVDGKLNFALDTLRSLVGRILGGQQPRVVAVAYSNPDTDPATGTTLYDIESNLDLLLTQNPPNSGTLNVQGGLGVNIRQFAGFDIAADNAAYASLQTQDYGPSALYTVNLQSGAAAQVGQIGRGELIQSIAVCLPASNCR